MLQADFLVGHDKSTRRAGAGALAGCGLAALALALLVGYPRLTGTLMPESAALAEVLQRGVLRVATRWAPTTYYQTEQGPEGFEYRLLQGFAEELGVALDLHVVQRPAELFDALRAGEVQLVAAGLTITSARQRRLRFGPVYLEVRPQLVYRSGDSRPRSLAAVDAGDIVVPEGSSFVEHLRAARRLHPELAWQTRQRSAQDAPLLVDVWSRAIRHTVVDSHELVAFQMQYPELRAALDLPGTDRIAWALSRSGDGSLLRAVEDYFTRLQADGSLDRLRERHLDVVEWFNYVDLRSFHRAIDLHLPALRELFERAALHHGLDWTLLAAMAYQESHWDPGARSPTGVEGLMMLTRATSRELDLTDRTDPRQSIDGGARYLRRMLERIPPHVPEPDRSWLALAAYNVGFGHLQDARQLARAADDNPDNWTDVKKYLPLLSDPRWYRQTRYGYCRGQESVTYVDNIRRYRRILEQRGSNLFSD